ncbi:hypothetical protein ACS0TY_003104 [Phlomoides rotata]
MDALDSVFDSLRDFAKDSVRLVKRCHKPDRKGVPLWLDSTWVMKLDYSIEKDGKTLCLNPYSWNKGAFYGFNYAMPVVRRWIKGPMWLHFLIGAPPVIIFSSGCAGLASGTILALTQLASSSYHAIMSSPPSAPPFTS